MLCCSNRLATPEVTICTENIVIPALGVGILITRGEVGIPS